METTAIAAISKELSGRAEERAYEVWVILSEAAWRYGDGTTFVASRADIVAGSDVTEAVFHRGLQDLVSVRLVEITKRRDDRGAAISSQYDLRILD